MRSCWKRGINIDRQTGARQSFFLFSCLAFSIRGPSSRLQFIWRFGIQLLLTYGCNYLLSLPIYHFACRPPSFLPLFPSFLHSYLHSYVCSFICSFHSSSIHPPLICSHIYVYTYLHLASYLVRELAS